MLKLACSTCLRAGQSCSGYREANIIRFVDQSVEVHRRYGATADPARSLDESLDTVALASFRYYHALDGRYNQLCTSVSSSYLTAAMQCLGLATQATFDRNAKHSQGARRYYIVALREVNMALQDEEVMVGDEVLSSIIMLSCFEAITGASGKSVAAWTQHVHGTAALIDKRGDRQMTTAEGRLLFVQASTDLIAACVRGHIRMPDRVLRSWESLVASVDEPEHAMYRVYGASLSVVNVCYDFSHGGEDANVIFERCLSLDRMLASAFDQCDSTWEYSVVPIVAPALTDSTRPNCPQDYHVYHDPMAVQLWNSMRSCRLLLHDMMHQILRLDPKFRQQQHGLTVKGIASSVQQIDADILASVPNFLNLLEAGRAVQRLELTPHLPLYSYRLPLLRSTQGHNWVWHLVLVARYPTMPRASRWLACTYMRQIGLKCGVQQAIYLAGTLEAAIDTTQ